MTLQEENDVLLRQIKAFAQGPGYLLARGGGKPGNEIIFPQKEAQKLPNQDQLAQFIKNESLHEATQFLFSRRYAIIELGTWYFQTLNEFTDLRLEQLDYSRSEIEHGLEQLARIQRGEV